MNYQKQNFGFTIIEIVVAIAIISVLATMGFLVSLDFYKSYAFNSERDIVISLLQKARSQSLNNIFQKPHGVAFSASQYVLYEGGSYLTRDSSKDFIVPANPSISNSGGEVVFAQLSAEALPITFTLTAGNRTQLININQEGMVQW